jgi:hypothetical protein
MDDHDTDMDDHDILLAIQELLDGTVWNIGMLEQIAEWLDEAGYLIHDVDEER